MPGEQHLLILGASTRAAAFSALRAGLRPCCADLFADADLQAHCPVLMVPPGRYPEGLAEIAPQGPSGPWMYTGALENRPALVEQISGQRPLWGNDATAIRKSRSPLFLDAFLAGAGLPRPAVRSAADAIPRDGRWLVKPLSGAGGAGIRSWTGPRTRGSRRGPVYFQEFIDGDAYSAVYLATGRGAQLLGITRQLVGEPWLHAKPFHYCGSIGHLPLEPAHRQALDRLGSVVAAGCGLRGLFGVDYILRDADPWPVEVNPRYTASVEVLEYTLGVPALALHRQAFDPAAPALPPTPAPTSSPVGKAVLFAKGPLAFPADGPWLRTLRSPTPLDEPPAFADIPRAGQRIKAGQPILSFFVRGDSPDACRDRMRQLARDLDRRLFE